LLLFYLAAVPLKAYISVSYSKRKTFDLQVQAIIAAVKSCGMVPFVFVDQYQFDSSQERAMMNQALADIDQSDLLIAETSDKGIGIGIETGYAKAKGKPVIYVRHTEAEHSTTVSGISDYQIIYSGAADLDNKLQAFLKLYLSDTQWQRKA